LTGADHRLLLLSTSSEDEAGLKIAWHENMASPASLWRIQALLARFV
jgi:hypothetical protein